MRRQLSIIAGVFAVVAGSTAVAEDALEVAKRVTSEGARILASKNVAAMMATYAEDCQVEVVSRNPSTGGLNRDGRTGKSEVQKLYEELFKSDSAIDARNVVEHARFLGSDLLLITGNLEAMADGRTSVFPFMQIRTREGDKWLITQVQVFLVEP